MSVEMKVLCLVSEGGWTHQSAAPRSAGLRFLAFSPSSLLLLSTVFISFLLLFTPPPPPPKKRAQAKFRRRRGELGLKHSRAGGAHDAT